MNKSYYNITLDIKSIQSQITLPVKQGDTSRGVIISLTDGGKPYTIAENCFAIFKGEKSDGTEVGNNCVIKNNRICYDFTEQTVASPGIVVCEVSLYDVDKGLITSPKFTLIVDARAVGSDEYKSSSEYNSLVECRLEVEENERQRQANEDDRASTFEENEAERQRIFESNEAERQNAFEKNELISVINYSEKINAHEYVANFDFENLTINDKGLSLTSPTGLPDHTNLLWCKNQIDSELLQFDVELDATTLSGYTRFFVANNANVNEYLMFRVSIINNTSYTYVAVIVFDGKSTGVVQIGSLSDTMNVDATKYKHNIKVRVANGILRIYVDNLYFGAFDLLPYFTTKKTLGCSYRSANTTNVVAYDNIKVKESNSPYLHISYDDCIRCLKDINTNANTYTSIFDNAFLASLRDMHINYGAVFTLNVFRFEHAGNTGFDLSNMTTKFKTEFTENADWLKFAVHWTVAGVKPEELTDSEVVAEYMALTDIIIAFSSKNNVDRMIRPSYYSLNKSSQLALKNANALFDGCLTADDIRTSNCGLTPKEKTILNEYDDYMDFENGIYYCRSTTRVDNLEQEAQVNVLNNDFADRKNNKVFIVFAHESDNTINLEAVCEWARVHNIRFDYPMNNIPKI